MYLFYFKNTFLTSDVVDDNGKVLIHATMAVIAREEAHARSMYPTQEMVLNEKGKLVCKSVKDFLDERFEMTRMTKLSSYWGTKE